MADIRLGDPFGLEKNTISSIDWNLALKRCLQDIRSDFIYAPHLALIYAKAGSELVHELQSQLMAGKFLPGGPVTIEVPKSSWMRIAASRRHGPNYSRPGSILLPRDRLLYQALADEAAPVLARRRDSGRSFSHRLAEKGSVHMFLPTRVSWSELQNKLRKYAGENKSRYILRLDIANYFGSINQHTLINTLTDAGYKASLGRRLEVMLTTYTGNRSSRAILQGMFPSDLLGNHYMDPIDRFLREYGVSSARYVDDLYVFVGSVKEANAVLQDLIGELRSYDLHLNEAKSLIMPKSALITEEPDLEALFADAVAEISSQIEEDDFDAEYGFQSEWEDDELDAEDEAEGAAGDLELEATKVLFDSINQYPGHEESIERFCLPLFSKAESDYAVENVLESFVERPSMAQIYTSYLSKFLSDENVLEALEEFLQNDSLADWQRMWVLAALLGAEPLTEDAVAAAWAVAKDARRHDALRAVACIFVGRYGDAARRRSLGELYRTTSAYVQAAIYYSSRRWPNAERANAKAVWGAQGELNTLLTVAMSK